MAVPYTDRYLDDSNPKFIRVLFRPGFAPQSRELIALQESLQRQISSIGDHLFKEGSKVVGGAIKHSKGKSLLIESTYNSEQVDISSFIGQRIVELDAEGRLTGATGNVFAVSPETDSDPACLHFLDESVDQKIGEGVSVRVENTSLVANIRIFENPVRVCQFARLLNGMFYYDKKFILVDEQLLVYSKFDEFFSGNVGLRFDRKIVTEADDSSLYDPARGYPNFNAPGAHREMYDAVFTAYTFNEKQEANFVSLTELQEGEIKTMVEAADLNELGDILADRTYDDAGDFVVRYFKADLVESIKVPVEKIEPSITSTLVAQVQTAIPHGYNVGDGFVIEAPSEYAGEYTVREILNSTQFTFDLRTEIGVTERNKKIFRTNYFGIQMSPGKAYVKGYQVRFPGTTNLEIAKARSTERQNNAVLTMGYGRYVLVENLKGMFDVKGKSQVILRDGSDAQIGTARVHSITNSGTNRFNVYLFDIAIDAGKDVGTIKKITTTTGPTTGAEASVVGDFNLRASNNRTLIAPIVDHEVATLQPNNVATLTYSTVEVMTQASSGTLVTFALTGNSTFVGPRVSDFHDTDAYFTNYILVDANKNVVNPTTAEISSDGKTITFGLASASTITMRASVTVKPQVKKKVKATTQVQATGVSPSNPKINLGVVDAYKVTITDSKGDITNRFTFDNGQRDDMYDFASVTLRAGVIAPEGIVTVNVEYFKHTGEGYFSVDSYTGIPYQDIPTYTFTDSNAIVNLRNVIDFRYVKKTGGFEDSLTPTPDNNLVFDFDYYLSRRDLVTITKRGSMKIVPGIPSMNPRYPTPSDDEMTLFKVHVNAYTGDYAEDVFVHRDQNIRYTHRDVGIIKKQVERLEYETSLSLLESSAKSENIVDENGQSRFKTGFLVDDFTGHGLGDTTSDDYRVSVDRQEKLIRPMFKEGSFGVEGFDYNGFIRVGNEDIGYFVMMPSTRGSLVENVIASKAVSVNPYLVTKRVGTIKMNPSSDYWKDTETAPIRNVDLTADLDNQTIGLGTVWNDWETTWTGSNVSTTTSRTAGGTATTTTNTKSGTANRTGEEREIQFSSRQESLGSYLIDANVSYFMRAIQIKFRIEGMRPNTDLFTFIDSDKIDDIVTTDVPVKSVGSVRVDATGVASGTINIPAGRFRTGERVFTFSDEPNNVSANATTEASFIFAAQGMTLTQQETMVSTAVPQIVTNVVSETKRVTESNSTTVIQQNQERERSGGERGGQADPLAQAFWVSPEAFPNGVFLRDITVYARRKPEDTSFPLILQIRPMVNGYPSSTDIIPFSEVNIPNEKVNIPTNINNMDSVLNTPTTHVYDVPIYLAPGSWYSFIALADNPDYEIYVAEMGQKVIGTETRIYQQPTLGSSFRSQNAETWTAYQNETIMFGLGICVFEPGREMSFNLRNKLQDDDFRFNVVNFRPQVLTFEDTRVNYEMRTRDSTNSNETSMVIGPRVNTNLPSEKIIRKNMRDVQISVKAITNDKYSCPFFDLQRSFGITVQNIVNSFGLVRRNFTIVNTGEGLSEDSTTINVAGGNGSGAILRPIIEDGRLIDIDVVNQGVGYTSAPTVTVASLGTTPAQVVFSGFETDPTGGNAEARYISKVVTLDDGFEADQANVYLDISSPAGTDVKIYYRSKNESDQESILVKKWKEITSNNRKTSVRDEFIETKFEVDLSYRGANNALFTNSNSVQVKIVLLAQNSSVVPRCKNFRLITSL
uniref:DUF4815 domain-containing protein n=1 Tax=Ochrobactrum phage ORM_20 TaxID=2985243 RepID=A0A9N6ZGF4_9VIRU|nr:hypothetical protein ORM20_00066 [Ochrobactrum phage ORM_20]